MRIDVPRQPTARLCGAWRHCVGTGRFDLALRRDYQDSLALVQREIGFRHIRGHGLLSDGTGIHQPYEHAGERRVRHAFTYVDQIVDAYLDLGIEPFLELGFMPSQLASGEDTVFWWKGNITPPRDEAEWADLVRGVLRHLIDRYGLDQVRRWPIEVWNEPNLEGFWSAGQDAYHRLYEVTSTAVKEVDAELQVGGPSLAPGYQDEWIRRFADFVETRDLPIDFVSRHAYSSGPVQPVPFGAHQTLMPASALLEQFGAPKRQLAGSRLAELPLHITEFNSSYRPDNPIHDTAFHAAYLAPVLVNGGDLADSFSYWTFSDVFEEVGIPTAPFHGGFGLLTHRQIKKPTYHLYTFMAEMGEQILARGEDHLVTRHEDGRVTVLAWAPADPTGGAPVEGHTLRLTLPVGTPEARGSAYVRRRSVSEDAGNARAAWIEMGRPLAPDTRRVDALHEAAEPARSHHAVPVTAGRAEIDLVLARNEVTLLELTPVVDETPKWWSEERLFGLGEEGTDASAT
ncbi:GH39 family glycosyl hydrolase [Streptomyces griseoaurantiacus]|uniref:GH39 family glycosyl hydrolase n=1 Tax=Streptomyces griseoaurantiacus TaxID=68213 RepID=UPI002ED109BE|nr:xylan 1,4-beta-xylosidase [Streptomyces jietaisiensis]